MQNELKEAEIRELYILAKNNNDIYHLTDKLIQPDTYNMNNIRPYWDLVGFMFRVPYLMFHYTPNIRSGYITTNDLGYRGEINFSHLPSVQVDKNYRYIVLLGGSAAFGAYSSSDEKCISAVLEKKLNNELKDGKPFKVINLGMGFYNSFQELISYLLYGLKYKPEVVITFDGFNDATVPLIQNKRVPLVSGGYYRIRKLIDGINKKFLKKKEINKLPSIKTKESASWDKESMDYENDVVELYKRNLDLICLISKNKGAKVLLCLQPIKTLPDGRFAGKIKQ
jgi:hypothetical protein